MHACAFSRLSDDLRYLCRDKAVYSQLSNTHVFVPVAIETWHHQSVELVHEIGRRTANITGDVRESNFQFQQLSVALQRGNAVSFQNTFTTS